MMMFQFKIGIHDKEFGIRILAPSKPETANTDFFSKLAEE